MTVQPLSSSCEGNGLGEDRIIVGQKHFMSLSPILNDIEVPRKQELKHSSEGAMHVNSTQSSFREEDMHFTGGFHAILWTGTPYLPTGTRTFLLLKDPGLTPLSS